MNASLRPLPCHAVDESVPSQQGLKQNPRLRGVVFHETSMSPFHHNKD